MRFRDLRGFPKLFADFVEGVEPAAALFVRAPNADALRSQAVLARDRAVPRADLCELVLEQARGFGCLSSSLANIERLRGARTVTVVATLRPALLCGPLASWLTVVTAARLAAWLTEQGVLAVPLCWIDAAVKPPDFTTGLISRQGPERLVLDGITTSSTRIPAAIQALLQQAARILETSVSEADVLQILEAAYAPGTDFSAAWCQAAAKLLDPLGAVFVDPHVPAFRERVKGLLPHYERKAVASALTGFEERLTVGGYERPESERPNHRGMSALALPAEVLQNLVLPVAANVITEQQAWGFVRAQALMSEFHMPPALAWPRISATILDARCRKTLSRYGISTAEAFSAPEALTETLVHRLRTSETIARIESLDRDLKGQLTDLRGLTPAGERVATRVEDSCRRMLYQVEKLGRLLSDARALRRDAISRQCARLCGIVAPWGGRQEIELAGFQFMLRHSNLLPRILYNSADPFKFEHQIISMD